MTGESGTLLVGLQLRAKKAESIGHLVQAHCLCTSIYTKVGKSRLTVMSSRSTEFILVLLFIDIVLFPIQP